jgi:hypothetical protein
LYLLFHVKQRCRLERSGSTVGLAIVRLGEQFEGLREKVARVGVGSLR